MNSYEDISSSKSCLEQELGPEDESSFLEKYFHDLIVDNCDTLLTNTLYRTLIDKIKNKKQLETILSSYIQEQIDLQQRQKIHSKYFYTKQTITIQKLTNSLKQLLVPEENLSGTSSTLSHSNEKLKKSFVYKSDFIELFENEFLSENREIQKGEMIYIDIKLKITNSKMKDEISNIRTHIHKQLLQQTHFNNNFFSTNNDLYDLQSITVMLFINGDINFDFAKYFELNQLSIGRKRFNIKLKVCYVSAVRLSQNFCFQNNLTTNVISQQNMAFYELKRYGQTKLNINKTISELLKMKKKVTYSLFKDYRFYIFAFGVVLTTGFLVKKAIINNCQFVNKQIKQ